MADNVNIIVQDTINDIVVNAAVVVETIDINVQAAVDEVQIIANPNNYVVNINRIIGEQVQSDWTQTDNQAPDYIKNKPTIPTATSDLTNDGEDGVNPFITAADVTPQVNSDWDATSGVAEILNKPTIPAAVTKTSDLTNDGENGVDPFITAADVPASVTSVGLTMPSAFSVANSPITSAGTLEVTGAGVVSQYVRGDGSLANFPTSTGGGASLSFYLNGSVSQGTIGGVAFREMDRTPILGAGTDFTINANGYIQSFITDANVPNLLEIPAGNWNFETYFSASSGGGSPSFYVELYKWNGTTLSLIASNSATPEGITNGTAIDLYISALAVPQTTLLATDRLAIRIYVTHSGRTIKLHTEDNHLCQVITTFSTGLTALNGLTTQVQSFATGTSGTDFGISSATSTHTFNLPTASAANRGALSSADWSTFNNKATDSLVVHLAGTETITGAKTFQNITTITPAALTGTAATSALDIAQTWNTTGAPTALKLNITDTASAVNTSLLMDLQVGGASRVQVNKTGALVFRLGSTIRPSNGTNAIATSNLNGLNFISNLDAVTTNVSDFIFINNQGNPTNTSGTRVLFDITRGFSPTSGTGQYIDLRISPTINQTGGANGITRGLYINPTLTAAADFRAIENSVGKVCLNTTSGNTMIGTFTDAGFKLDVNGTARVVSTLVANAGVRVGGASGVGGVYVQAGSTLNQETISLRGSLLTTDIGSDIILSSGNGSAANTTSIKTLVRFSGGFVPASGTGVYNVALIDPTINQTGGANGITRGLYINPTLTSAADFRAIETARGNVVFGNLPTSAAGLPTGAIWNDSGTLKIV